MRKYFAMLFACAVASGCAWDSPVDLGASSPDLKVAGNSGCATVAFNIAGSVLGVSPLIPITGDLEGTFTPTFMGDTKFAGATQANEGTAVFDITGGILGAFTFETTFKNRNIDTDRPGSPATEFENIGSHRALSGAEKANLTYLGTFSIITFEIDHDYHGVICQ